ncbi:MAG: hypothetical protein QNI84_07610 [Henriciella sp.]|nr:hypothetical protein [Henriciella sp.]
MRIILTTLAFSLSAACAAQVAADPVSTEVSVTVNAPTEAQVKTFGPLASLVGQSFRGNPMNGSSEPNPDTQKWEWALGGTAILIRHALADGSYGGDTYVYKDSTSGDLVYVYITNAGFRTEGVMTVNEDGSYTAVEAVNGHPEIVEVRSTSVLNEDGSTSMSSEYVTKDGTVTPGHSFTYQPTTEPLPKLKPPAAKPPAPAQ